MITTREKEMQEKVLKLIFNEEAHTYTLDGTIIPSVTQIISKVFGSSYDNVNADVLQAASARGTLIHKEIENYTLNNIDGFTDELEAFKTYCEKNKLIFTSSEQKIYGEIDGMAFAGTYDLVSEMKYILADIKTTARFDKTKTQIQMSFYYYALNELGIKIDKILGLHLKNEDCKAYELEVLSTVFLKDILQKYYSNEQMEIVAATELESLPIYTIVELAEIEKNIKNFEEQKRIFYDKIQKEMEEKGIKSFNCDLFKITLIEPTTRESIDTTKLKKEMPEIAEKFIKQSNIRGSIRLTLKRV